MLILLVLMKLFVEAKMFPRVKDELDIAFIMVFPECRGI